MGHTLSAIIGPTKQVSNFASRWVQARRVELRQDFSFVPLTNALHDDINELADLSDVDPYDAFVYLSAGVCQAIVQASHAGFLGYIETDYFGGNGSQSAMAWYNGVARIGPLTSKSTADHTRHSSHTAGFGAIHSVLVAMGVTTRASQDAFDALQLGRFRRTE